MATTQKFLSYAGLEKFWALIKTKFGSSLDVAVNETSASVSLKDANGTVLDTKVIPGATNEKAGVMTAAHVQALEAVSGNIQTAIKFEGMQFGGNDATLAGKKANVGLNYNSTDKLIEIVDLNNNSAVLTSLDATNFIADGLLYSSDVIESNGVVQLQLVFKNGDGETLDPVFINVTDLVSQYSAGAGLQLLSEAGSGFDNNDKHTGVFAVKTNSEYLSADTNGLTVTAKLMEDVQAKADAAQEAAEATASADATSKANTAEANAKAYAETKASEAQTNAITTANGYTDTKIGEVNAKIGTVADDKTVVGMIADAQAAAEKTAKEYTDAEVKKLTENGVAGALEAAKDYTDAEIVKVNTTITTEIGKVNDKIGTVAEGKTVVGMIADAESAANGYTDTEIGKLDTKAQGYATNAAATALSDAKTYTNEEIGKLDAEEVTVMYNTSGEGDNAVSAFRFKSKVTQVDGKLVDTSDENYAYEISTISAAEITAIVNA